MSGPFVRTRVVEAAGADADRARTASRISDHINAQMQRYPLVLVFTGAVVGVSTWIVLAVMGVKHASMWGLLACVFSSIPYFGRVIVAGGLFAVGMVQGGTTHALQMSGPQS